MAFRPLDPDKDIRRYRNHLPHWRQDHTTYFVTIRLGDSIPQEKLVLWEQERKDWLKAHDARDSHESVEALPDALRHEYHRRFTQRFHEWLDAGYGACWLKRSDCSRIVSGALHHFDEERYSLESFVVMPNHLHVLATPMPDVNLSEVLHSWKSYTSHEMGRMLGRGGTLWQQESYNHLVRSEEQFEHYRRYIHANPMKARLKPGEFVWWDALGVPNPK